MKFHYYRDTDSLYIELSDKVGADSQEVAPGVVRARSRQVERVSRPLPGGVETLRSKRRAQGSGQALPPKDGHAGVRSSRREAQPGCGLEGIPASRATLAGAITAASSADIDYRRRS